MVRYGGQTPSIGTGLRLTVEAPDSAATVAVLPGDILKFGGTAADGTGYKVTETEADDSPGTSAMMCKAETRSSGITPITVVLLNPQAQVTIVAVDTVSPPSVGQSVKIGSTPGRFVGKAYNGDGYVLSVDASLHEAEVLL